MKDKYSSIIKRKVIIAVIMSFIGMAISGFAIYYSDSSNNDNLKNIPYIVWIILCITHLIGFTIMIVVGMWVSAKLLPRVYDLLGINKNLLPYLDVSWVFIFTYFNIIIIIFLFLLLGNISDYLGIVILWVIFLIVYPIVNHYGSKFCDNEQRCYFLGPFIDHTVIHFIKNLNKSKKGNEK